MGYHTKGLLDATRVIVVYLFCPIAEFLQVFVGSTECPARLWISLRLCFKLRITADRAKGFHRSSPVPCKISIRLQPSDISRGVEICARILFIRDVQVDLPDIVDSSITSAE